MKHNFMTKMVSALLAVVLSTAAFSVTAFASGGEESTESMAEQETVMFLICFPLWQAARSRYPSPRMVSSSVPVKMTPGRPVLSPRAAAI